MGRLKTFKGFICEGNIIGKSNFKIFGEMSDGTKCYHRIEDKDDDRAWYTRRDLVINDIKIRLFFIEGFTGNKEEYDEYIKDIHNTICIDIDNINERKVSQ